MKKIAIAALAFSLVACGNSYIAEDTMRSALQACEGHGGVTPKGIIEFREFWWDREYFADIRVRCSDGVSVEYQYKRKKVNKE